MATAGGRSRVSGVGVLASRGAGGVQQGHRWQRRGGVSNLEEMRGEPCRCGVRAFQAGEAGAKALRQEGARASGPARRVS